MAFDSSRLHAFAKVARFIAVGAAASSVVMIVCVAVGGNNVTSTARRTALQFNWLPPDPPRDWILGAQRVHAWVPLLSCPAHDEPLAKCRYSRHGGCKREDLTLQRFFSIRCVNKADTNRYRIFQQVGRGAHGIVVFATDLRTGETVAIKKQEIGRAGWEAALQHLVQGSDFVIRIKNVLPVTEKCSVGFMVIEKMDSVVEAIGDLWSKIDGIPAHERRQILLNMVLAVHHMHTSNVVHLDIHQKNVMFRSSDCMVKFGDFGSAKARDPVTGAFYVSHRDLAQGHRPPETRLYDNNTEVHKYVPPQPQNSSSPEEFYKWHMAVASDMWSLGWTMLAVLIGRDPISHYKSRSGVKHRLRITQQLHMLGLPTEEMANKFFSRRAQERVHTLRSNTTFRDLHVREKTREAFSEVDDESWEFIFPLLALDPTKRPTTNELLQHPYLASLGHASGSNQGAPTAYGSKVAEVIHNKELFENSDDEDRHELKGRQLYDELSTAYRRHAYTPVSLQIDSIFPYK
mmetsp:Transcript_20505/g.56856  ORF Transcript_20505/g.56856 Transcript_20505/m.56856 type:complete len:516 (+) Transcript_20505:256-1803(+)|eukprot:CAMPEP_0117660176 /NCGR_PEP_ID=MMETSP0804-20121206/6827_1 /TAXON_ID=1074897 /ORGANISM="Tetraselmis astigmatica, Strain CCMP880" /LENGTH=515 /DNA_ID=CAMNT_0005466885 /DNA_START=162 /DNA_END=1709 /DNA_ORIENTATION=-